MGSVKTNIVDLEVVYNKLNTSIDKNIILLKEGATAVDAYNKKISVIPSQFQKSLEDIKTKTDAVTKSTKNLNETEKQVLLTAKQREQQSVKESNARNSLLKQKEREIAKNKQLNSAYLQLSKAEAEAARKLQDLIAQGKRADQTQKQYNSTLKVAQNNFDQLRAKLIMADSATQRFNRNVGNYPQMFSGMAGGLKQLMSAFGVVGGIYLFANAIRGAFTTVKEFDKANADLAATMGKSRAQIIALTNDQKRLGATTKYTATEVAGLQKEFAKLGFSEKEILNSTEATLALASAVDTDLANAAMVSGSTLRGFGLDASEMGRVVDVMAKSFTSSALDVENFKESMKYVAPIARASGVSIEFTTAMLGKLADNGVKGSQAGTSLRRILAEMAKTGLPAAQALDKVAKSGISVTDAMDEVGRTAQTSLLILSKSKDGINELAKALDNAGGSAQKMADEQLNSLEGQLTLLSSAWDGFILSFQKGEGIFSSFFKVVIGGFTKILGLFTRLNDSNNYYWNESDRLQKENIKKIKRNYDEETIILEKANEDKIQSRRKFLEDDLKIYNQELETSKLRIKLFESNISKSKSADITYKNQLLLRSERDLLKSSKLMIDITNARIKAHSDFVPTIKKETEVIDENSIELKNNTDKTKENAKAKQDVRFALLGSVEWFEKLKSSLETEQKQVSTNSEKWQEYKVKIDQVEKSIKAITEASKELEGVNIDINDTADVTDAEGDKLIQAGKDFRLMLKEFQESFITDFADNSGFGKMLDILNGGLDKFEGDAKSTALAVSDAFQEAFNTISQASQANFDAEYSRLEAQRDFSISFAGDSATAKEEIERQYNERKKAIQRREAEAQKRLAIFNAIIDTAQAVVAALPNYGLAIAVGIIGAAQIALISSQPVPQFYKGTDNAPEGWALTQERGAEVITDKKGNVKTLGNNKGAQMTYLNKGDKVYKSHNDYINKELSKNGIQEMGGLINLQPKVEVNNSFDMEGMKQEFSKLAKVISNKEGVNISIDERGFNKRKGNTSYINSRLTLKSQQV